MASCCLLLSSLCLLVATSNCLALKEGTRSACINDTVGLRGRLDGHCTSQTLKWQGPNRIVPSSTKYVVSLDGFGLTIRRVQHSDEGNYTLKQLCTEGLRYYLIRLKVNCQHMLAYLGSTIILTWPNLSGIPEQSTVKTKIQASFPDNTKVWLVLKGKVTDDCQKIFGARLTLGQDGHTLRIENIMESEAGNYTIIRQWNVEDVHLTSKSYTYSITLKVTNGSSSRPTMITTKNRNHNSSSNPTDQSIVHGGATMMLLYNGFPLLLIAIVFRHLFLFFAS